MRIRCAPEDFVVDELPLYAPSGEGSHTFVRIEKRGLTTPDAIAAIARALAIDPREIGSAGLKDKHALTRQWISVPALDPQRALELEAPGLRVLEAARHPHKLRTGHLGGNRFEIAVREIDDAPADLARRIERIERIGMPNRFGPQRYGLGGRNAERARALLEKRWRPRDRREARFLLSALQSECFDAMLAARPLALDEVEVGDVARVEASGGLFVVEDLEREAPRAAAFEISAAGPIFGTRMLEALAEPGRRERALLADRGIDPSWPDLPKGLRLPGARRAYRVRPRGLSIQRDVDGLLLRFELPPGSYATVLLEELLGQPFA